MSRNLTTSTNTPTIIEVPSTAGFSAGDLVYYANGTYGNGSVATFPSTVSIPVTSVEPSQAPPDVQNYIFNPDPNSTSYRRGGSNWNYAATLTNGNVVQVWMPGWYQSNQNQFQFQIVNSTLTTVVVQPVTISTTYTQSVSSPQVGVLALTGGGFVVYMAANSPSAYLTYAIYDNSGNVVTAVFQDSTTPSNTSSQTTFVSGLALANGGFLIAYNTSTNVYARAYGATGTGTFAWLTFTGQASVTYYPAIATRSDSSWLIAYPSSTNSTMNYAIYNASGTAIVAQTRFLSSIAYKTTTLYSTSASTLSDGTTFVLGYMALAISGNGPRPVFRFIPTGNTLGTEYEIPYQNCPQNATVPLTVKGLSSGNFVMLTGTSTNNISVQYAVFDSSGNCLSGTYGTYGSTNALPRFVNTAPYTNPTQCSVLDSSGSFYVFYNSLGQSRSWLGQRAFQVNKTTWLVSSVNPITASAGNATVTPTAFSPSGSTPTAFAYTGANGNAKPSGSLGTIISSGIITSAYTCYSLDSCVMPNGNIAVAVNTGTTGVFVYIYTPTGTLVTTYNPITTSVYGNSCTLRMVCLTSGKFAIAWTATSASSAVTVALFTSTFTQIGSNTTLTSNTAVYNYYGAGMTALGNDMFAVSYYNTSGYPAVVVYSNSLTNLFSAVASATTSTYGMTLSGNDNGDFVITWHSSTSGIGISTYVQTTSTNWVQTYTSPTSWLSTNYGTYNSSPGKGVALNNNMFGVLTCYNSANNYQAAMVLTDTNSSLPATYSIIYSGQAGNTTYGNSLGGAAIGVNGYGLPVVVYLSTTNITMNIAYGTASNSGGTIITLPYSISSGHPSFSIAPAYGPNILLSYISVSGPVLVLMSGGSFVTVATLSSSTPSTKISVYPTPTTATSPAITGTVLTGVAVTPASAGGTGQIQTSGSAQLNSNYASTGTNSFDTTGQAVQGIRGIANGQNVIITGNT